MSNLDSKCSEPLIWDQQNETMPREVLRKKQLQRLQQTLAITAERVPCYQEKFAGCGFSPGDVQKLEQISNLPFTTKNDLRSNYPYGMFAVPMREVVRIHSSSGTTGKPTVVGYTRNDLEHWAQLVARFMTAAGVTADDIVHIAFGYGLFTGAFGLHYGSEKIGASVIPMSGGNTDKQLMIMEDYQSSALVCTPSYALTMADRMEKRGIDPQRLSLRVGLFGAEPWSEQMRHEIETRLGIIATDNYGLSEVMGPGVAGECLCRTGMHIAEDQFLAEIINPETGQVLPEGAVGELVITSLCKEAFPVVRYRTRDITSLNYETCDCGRTFARIEKIRGRSDDMLIIKGVNVFPTQIEDVLFQIEGCQPHYQLIVDRVNNTDSLEIQIEVNEKIFFDKMMEQRRFVTDAEHKIASVLGISSKIKLIEPSGITRHEGKACRVIDRRKF